MDRSSARQSAVEAWRFVAVTFLWAWLFLNSVGRFSSTRATGTIRRCRSEPALQLGLDDLGRRLIGMSGTALALTMALLAILTGVWAIGFGWWMGRGV